MSSKTNQLIWCGTFALSLCVSVAILLEMRGIHCLPGVMHGVIDRGIVTKVIVVVFLVSLLVNARNSLSLFAELNQVKRGLQSDPSSSRLRLVGGGLLGEHADRLHRIYGHSFEGEISQEVSLGVISNRLFRNEWLVRTSSQLLLTLGLIGTVLGMAKSLDGLATSIRSMPGNASLEVLAESEQDSTEGDFATGLESAVSGMSSAFATTLIGAVMGGVLLKLLTSSTQNLGEDLVDEIELVTEVELVPLLRATNGEVTDRRREMLSFMDQTVEREKDRLKSISQRIQVTMDRFDALANSMANANRPA